MTSEPDDADAKPLVGGVPIPPHPTRGAGEVRYSVLSVKAIWAAAALIMLVGIGVAVWLLLTYGGGGDQARNQLEAIKTAGTIVVGTGGAAALLLAARRQRTAEIALKQKDRDQADVAQAHALQERIAAETKAHNERVATATEKDTVERRVTELYTKAADQVGSDKSPVRLAGLYALERLAQNNPDQRQTIVNLLCAYLRMPCQLPGDPPGDDADDGVVAGYHVAGQEREVRLTAQRLLTDHLTPGDDNARPVETFWPDMDLDLTNATLINFTLHGCMVRTAVFRLATFTGNAFFGSARFTGNAFFGSATFTGDALFRLTIFSRSADFKSATFAGRADFLSANFTGDTDFRSATFTGDADFTGATFTGDTYFGEAAFTGDAYFKSATFADEVFFRTTTFSRSAYFGAATFAHNAWFKSAAFTGDADFTGVTFTKHAVFRGTNFARGAPPEVVAQYAPPDEEDGEGRHSTGTRSSEI